MTVLIECYCKKWELLNKSISSMHNICCGDIFLGLEKVKNLWEELIFGFVLWSSWVRVKLSVLLHHEIGRKVVKEELDE